LDNRFSRQQAIGVTVNGKFSTSHDVISGIPQGSILGPLLFIIYIDDLPNYCNDLHTKLYIYTDDTKLYGHFQYCGSRRIAKRYRQAK